MNTEYEKLDLALLLHQHSTPIIRHIIQEI